MSRERFQKVDQLYQMACDLPVGQRQAFLSRECEGDAELLQELQSLLAHDEAASSEFLEEPAFVSQDSPGGPASIPERIGHYHLKRLIASGGMGTVYAAVQEHPRRAVAVKVMKHGIASRSALRRFEFESQVLARLRHPGIAQVHEAGTHNDGAGPVPFFAMEYIPNAKPITRYAADAKLGTRERLALFIHVCDAVHHGHQKGVIHRDLKPGNVLVDTQGQVKIIDFGVARCTDSDMAITTLQTDIGQLVGTLQYMSPEQCETDPTDIDPRSDVYALGVMLYEVLTEQLPYDVRQVAMHQATRVVREQHPAKPSTFNKTLRGDIETITLKALEKDRTRRYQSASDLAQDIQRYLDGEAILARPPSFGYQLQVLARRNKAAFAAIAAVFLVLTGAAVVSFGLYLRTERARVEATGARDESEAVTAFLSDMFAAANPTNLGRDVPAYRVLDIASERIGQSFPDRPLVEARLRSTMAVTYIELGLYEKAEMHLAEAAGIYRRELGASDARTLSTVSKLANAKQALGRYAESETLLRDTFEAQSRILGEDHPDTLTSLNILAHAINGQGRHAEAMKLRSTAVDLSRRRFGEDAPRTIAAMSNLSISLFDNARYGDCEELRRKVHDSMRRRLGDSHPHTIGSMYNLAHSLDKLGRYGEAEALYRKALDGFRSLVGEEHSHTLMAMAGLADIFRVQFRYAEAEDLYRRISEVHRREYGETHPETLEYVRNLASVLLAQRRHQEAETLYCQTRKLQLEAHREQDAETLKTLTELALLLARQGRFEEAADLYGEAIASYKERANDPSALATDLDDYASLLLGCEVRSLRDPQAALQAASRAVELTESRTFAVLDTLAQAYRATGRMDRAVETHRKAIALLPSEESPTRADLESRLGELLVEQRNYAEAEPLLLHSLMWMEEHITVPDRLSEFRQRVVTLFESWDAAEPGKGYREKAVEWRAKMHAESTEPPSDESTKAGAD